MNRRLFLMGFILLVVSSLHAQWRVQPSQSGASLWDVNFVDPNAGFAIGWVNSTSTFLKTKNGGGAWTSDTMPNTYMFSASFQDTANGYLAGYDFGCSCGYIRKTTDAGNSWTDSRYNETFGFYNVIMQDKNNGWASGYNGRILFTHDGWASHDSGQTGTGSVVFRELNMANADTLYAGGGPDFETQNLVYRSTDAGKSWTKVQDLTGKVSIAGLYFLNGKTGFIAGSNGDDVIEKTTDGGATWAVKYKGTNSADLVDGISFNGGVGYAVTSSGKILRSTDNGETWTAETPATAHSLYWLQMVSATAGYAVGEAGTIVKRGTTSGIKTQGNADALVTDVFPNPFQGQLNVSLQVPDESPVIMSLFDMNGRVMKIAQERPGAGLHTLLLPVAGLPGGVYYLKVQTNTGMETRQVIAE